jgi:hypothetical protein
MWYKDRETNGGEVRDLTYTPVEKFIRVLLMVADNFQASPTCLGGNTQRIGIIVFCLTRRTIKYTCLPCGESRWLLLVQVVVIRREDSPETKLIK